MTSDWRPGTSEPRATDGLDWTAQRLAAPRPGPGAEPPPGPPVPPPGPKIRLVVALGVLAGLAAGAVSGATAAFLVAGDGDRTDAPAQEATPPRQEVELTTRVADVAAAVRPAVVRIESTRRTASGGSASDIGSGVLIDGEGHVLTNAHVVLGTETLVVVLSDGQRRSAALIGHDFPYTDLAVLLVGPVNQAPAALGDSSRLRPGDTVIAIGNPLAEFDGSVTAGIVSGINRVRTFDGVRQEDLIQIDAAINHGNSGGALLNLAGEVVGLPTAIIRESQGQAVEGIAFALPSNRVRSIANGIIDAGANYPRPTLGVEVLDLTPEVLSRLPRLAVNEGAIVVSIAASGPAATAGLQTGDIIVECDGNAVDREHPFLNSLANAREGQSVKVVFNRNGRIIETNVQLGKRS